MVRLSGSAEQHRYAAELRPPPRYISAVLVLLAVLVEVVAERGGLGQAHSRDLDLALTMLVTSAVIWVLSGWNASVAAWFGVMSSLGLVLLASEWIGGAILFQMAWVPVMVAGVFVGLAAASAVGVLAVALVLGAPFGPSVTAELSQTSVVCIGAALAGMIGAYLPIYRSAASLSEHARQAQVALQSARRQSEQAQGALVDLANANRQLVSANQLIASLRARAENAEQAKTMFVAKVSHEFRTPLNMIIGLVSLMVETPHAYSVSLPPEMRSDLEVVQRNCRHLSRMIDDVLDLTRMRSGHLELHRERVDLSELLRAAAETVHPLVEKKGLAIKVQATDDLPRVYCDRTRIQQVVLNLVSNAVRFTERGKIELSVALAGERAMVRVSDTGPGIAAEDVERIFEPFQQSSTRLWQDKGGSGLGLAISREFVQRHGGRLWLETEMGVGTTFYFDLPLSLDAEHLVRPDRWVRADWVWREDAFRTESVRLGDQAVLPRLVLCDEMGSLSEELRRYADRLQLVEAHGVEGAAEALQACPANVVMLNVRPADLIAQTEAAGRLIDDTPIVACSIPPRIDAALRAGACGYLTKPVSYEELGQVVSALDVPVRRVLVVDDDPDVVRLWERMLKAHDGALLVSHALGGYEALKLMAAERPDLVLLDVYMPDIDGWQVLERKNDDPALRDIVVVMVSAHDPAKGPPSSPFLAMAMASGLTVDQLLRVSLQAAEALVSPGEPGRLGSQ